MNKDMNEEIVWIPIEDGNKLEGLVKKPDGEGPFPTVVFVSGLGMNMHEYNNSFDEIAKLLVAQGIMTVQFTFPIFDKEGRCREIPITKRGKITQEVLAWARNAPGVDGERIGLLAQSYGGATALGMNLIGIKTLVLVSGAYFPKQSIAQVYIEKGVKINYSGDTSLPRSSGENTTVGKEFWEDVESTDDERNAKQIHVPVFMVHGDQDTKIPVKNAEKVFHALVSKVKRLKIFKGGDHGIINVPRSLREEFLADVVSWFQKTI